MPRVSRFQNGGVFGKTLDFTDTISYSSGSTNKKNSGIWNLPAVYDALSGSSGLYTFSSFTFTSAGVYGYLGPTKTQLLNSYDTTTYTWLNNTSYYDSTDGFQNWTVPATGNYTFEIAGGTGGNSVSRTLGIGIYGGKGAKLTFTVVLTEGDILKLLVGQRGPNNSINSRGAGGGGGTYVYNNTTATLIAAAGGGGGAGDYGGADNQPEVNANHSGTSGYAGYHRTTANGGAAGGTNGSGGSAYTYGSGGAGWLSDGTDATYSLGGHRFLATTQPGWGGGHYNKVYTNNTDTGSSDGTNGGFGGGGGSYAGAGGGGGYSGGGGGYWSYSGAGGGGGSYIITTASSISTTLGNYYSNGYITVTKV